MCNTSHRFIELASESLGYEDAESRVLEAIRSYGIKESKKNLRGKDVTIDLRDGKGWEAKTTFEDLIRGTMSTGVVPDIDRLKWCNTDPFGTIALATESEAFPPFQIGTGERTSESLKGPGYLTNDPVSDVLKDILFYRQEVARLSFYEDSFKPCFRAYRAYLSSCITSVDAFINRQRWIALNNPSHELSTSDRDALKKLNIPIPAKFEKWVPVLSKGKNINLEGNPWMQNNKIRVARNEFVHLNNPDYLFSLKKTADVLNYCRTGVGQLLLDLSSLIEIAPSPAIWAVRFAPKARFKPKRKSPV